MDGIRLESLMVKGLVDQADSESLTLLIRSKDRLWLRVDSDAVTFPENGMRDVTVIYKYTTHIKLFPKFQANFKADQLLSQINW